MFPWFISHVLFSCLLLMHPSVIINRKYQLKLIKTIKTFIHVRGSPEVGQTLDLVGSEAQWPSFFPGLVLPYLSVGFILRLFPLSAVRLLVVEIETYIYSIIIYWEPTKGTENSPWICIDFFSFKSFLTSLNCVFKPINANH